jgi:hypothetical protein
MGGRGRLTETPAIDDPFIEENRQVGKEDPTPAQS